MLSRNTINDIVMHISYRKEIGGIKSRMESVLLDYTSFLAKMEIRMFAAVNCTLCV